MFRRFLSSGTFGTDRRSDRFRTTLSNRVPLREGHRSSGWRPKRFHYAETPGVRPFGKRSARFALPANREWLLYTDFVTGYPVVRDAGLSHNSFGRSFGKVSLELCAQRANGLMSCGAFDGYGCADRLAFGAFCRFSAPDSSGSDFRDGIDRRECECGCAGGRRKGRVSFFE